LPSVGWPWELAIGFAYFLVISAIVLLPLLFREKRWKLIAGGVALVLLISALAINLLLLARWAG
jgi:glucan phosphoethanolaminetransferase (alkaline phosphatase superfamily)